MHRNKFYQVIHSIPDAVPNIGSAIAPFGFEVMPDLDARSIRPKRAYIYLSITARESIEETIGSLTTWFIRHAGSISTSLGARSISRVSFDNRRATITLDESGDLSCFVYLVDTRGVDILDCYGNYISGMATAIRTGSLNEMQTFETNPACRRFVFQATRMLTTLYNLELDLISENTLLEATRRNGSSEPGTSIRSSLQASPSDLATLVEVVFPIVDRVVLLTTKNSDRRVEWIDFHSGASATLTFNGRQELATQRTTRAYRHALGLGQQSVA